MAENKSRIRILIIEDNLGDARLIQEVLNGAEGINVELDYAQTLSKGMDTAGKEKPDVILLDLNLPDSQGLDTIVAVASKMKELPIVVLTGGLDASKGVEALQLGAEDYLIKGKIDADILSRAIRYAIERHRLKKAEIELARQEEQRQQEQSFIERMGTRLKEAEALPEKRLNREIAEDISLKYTNLLEAYVKNKNLEREDSLIDELCQQFIDDGITPKGILDIHLKAIPQIGALGSVETKRIAFEVRMVLLAVMTRYAGLLKKRL